MSQEKLVIIIESEKTMRELTKRMLMNLKEDLKFLDTENANTAFEWCKERSPDLILTAWETEEMSGIDFTQKFRAEIDQTTPIVFCTARAFQEDKEKAFASGCTRYIAKPFFIEDLERVLKEVKFL